MNISDTKFKPLTMKPIGFSPKKMALLLGAAFAFSTSAGFAATINVPTDHPTIQAAIDAAMPSDTIVVGAGSYPEHLTISKALTLKGAQAGAAVGGRTSAGPSESTIVGAITITAADVTVDGFSQNNAGDADINRLGVLVKTAGNNAVIQNNIIDGVGSAANILFGGSHAIYLENGPDNATIQGNAIANVRHGDRTSSGVLIGDSTSASPSLGILIQGNSISEVTTGRRGAYGILINNGSGTGVEIRDNLITQLTGGPILPSWAHAIGLEGDTPDVIVEGNAISDVTSSSPAGDTVAVFFQNNPSYFTGHVNGNTFDNVPVGIALHPTTVIDGPVDGSCNWWGNASGPSGVGPGTGSAVGPGVTFAPWRITPTGPCTGGLEPRQAKIQVGNELIALLGTISNSSDRKKLQDAINHLGKSVEMGKWNDDSHPKPGSKGEGVFKEEKTTVTKLRELRNANNSNIPAATLQVYINILVEADAQIAAIAIDDAVSNPPFNQTKINAANAELNNGDIDAANDQPDKAIEHYKNAWKNALAAG